MYSIVTVYDTLICENGGANMAQKKLMINVQPLRTNDDIEEMKWPSGAAIKANQKTRTSPNGTF